MELEAGGPSARLGLTPASRSHRVREASFSPVFTAKGGGGGRKNHLLAGQVASEGFGLKKKKPDFPENKYEYWWQIFHLRSLDVQDIYYAVYGVVRNLCLEILLYF